MSNRRMMILCAVVAISLGMVSAALAAFAPGKTAPLPPAPEPQSAVPQNQFVFTNTDTIPNLNSYTCPNFALLTIYVPVSFPIADLNVGINLHHTLRQEVYLSLTAPDGNWVTLIDSGSADPYQNYDLLLDSEVNNPINDLSDDDPAYPYYDRAAQPSGSLTTFNGLDAYGVWTLSVCDNQSNTSTGNYNIWTLFFTEANVGPDLAPSYKSTVPILPQGENVPYIIHVENGGDATAYNVTVSDTLPAHTTLVTGSLTGGATYDPSLHRITWQGNLDPRTSQDLEFSLTPPNGFCGPLDNLAEISAGEATNPFRVARAAEIVPQVLYTSEFEANNGGFSPSGDWQWGIPNHATYPGGPGGGSRPNSPNLWGTQLGGPYTNGLVSHLTRSFDLTAVPTTESVLLKWSEWLDTEAGYDFASVLLNGQGAMTSSGSSNGWRNPVLDLSPFIGQIVSVDFVLETNPTIDFPGWYLDDVSVFIPCPSGSDLSLEKSASPEPIAIGEMLTYQITVTNWGPEPAYGVSVEDILPASVTFQNTSPGCGLDGASVFCYHPQLFPGESQIYTITVVPNQAGRIQNYAEVSDYSDPHPENNAAAAWSTVTETPSTAPIVESVSPNHGVDTGPTLIQITGANLVHGSSVYLMMYPSSTTQIPVMSYPSDRRILAEVPAGLTPGAYPLIVVNPANEAGRLLNAFHVLSPTPPTLTAMTPRRAANNHPVRVSIRGANLTPDMTFALMMYPSSTSPANETDAPIEVFPLGGLVFLDSEHIRATVPLSITPGLYDLYGYAPGDLSIRLPNAYWALDGRLYDDVFAQEADFWLDPPSISSGGGVVIGVNVRRRTGAALPPGGPADVPVDYFLGASSVAAGGIFLGQGIAEGVGANDVVSTTLPWAVGLAPGNYLVYAVMEDVIPADANPDNNIISRTIRVLPNTGDFTPPIITQFSIDGGNLATNAQQVHLSLAAIDPEPSAEAPNPLTAPALASGLNDILYVEYLFAEDLGDWQPVAYSGWQNYTTAANTLYLLFPERGLHFIQAWVSDHAGNISLDPAVRFINYLPNNTYLAHDETHLYRVPLQAGAQWKVRLTSNEGNSHLYIWGPVASDPLSYTLVLSDTSANLVKNWTFTMMYSSSIAGDPGFYQIEIYGFEDGLYTLELLPIGPPPPRRAPEAVRGHVSGRDQPLIVLGDEPTPDVGLPATPTIVFLPALVR